MSTNVAEAPTIGVEEEFLLVDPATGHPVPRNEDVAAAAARNGVELQLELTRCQVETTSPVAHSAEEVRKYVTDLRRVVTDAAKNVGILALAVAVPPSVPDEFPVTDTDRYRKIAARFGMIASEQGICGCHVHVAVPNREIGVQVSNRMRPWLPTLLALTANSSVYRDSDSGHASWRSVLWSRWPSAGPPPHIRDLDHYHAIVEMMRASGSILDDGMVYWDIRLSAHLPTIEVRVGDVPATADETVLFATLVRAAVTSAMRDIEDGVPEPFVAPEIVRAAYWKAAHDGMAGDAVDCLGGRVIAADAMVNGLVDYCRPVLDEWGEYDVVADLLDIVRRRGNGAQRQRLAFRRRGDVADVLAECAAGTVR